MNVNNSNCLPQLNRDLHHFEPSQFGCLNDLRNITPTDEGWCAVMVACSECGFQVDQNSVFDLGQLMILQNFGNVVLPSSENGNDMEVTDLIQQQGLKDIIICGHLNCRTVKHFTNCNPDRLWLAHSEPLKRILDENYSDLDQSDRENIAVQENVLIQLEKTASSIESIGIFARIYGWIFASELGRVFMFDPIIGQFS